MTDHDQDTIERKKTNSQLKGSTESLRNMGEAEQLPKELIQSEVMYKDVLNGMIHVVNIIDDDLTIIWANKTAMEKWGDIIGKKCYEIYKGRDTECPDCTVRRVFKDGKTLQSERPSIYPNGTRGDFIVTSSPLKDSQGNVVAVIEMLTDITERKKLDIQLKEYTENLEKMVEERTADLKESEERYRGLFESSKDGIASADLEGKIIECNQAYADMLGYTKEELYNLTFWDLLHSKWHDMTTKIHAEQVFTKGYSDEYEKEFIKKDGTIIPISVRVWLIKDEAGNPAGTWAIVRDITERKKLDQMKSQFITTAAHELRTPLSALKAHVDLLEMKSQTMNLPEDINRRIEIITRNANRLAVLINNLLDYTRLEAGTVKLELELGSLESVTIQAIKEVLPLVKKHRHTLDLSTPEPLPFIYMDKVMIHAIFNNLLSNAIKYTPDGGKIRVTLMKEDDNIHVTVKDTGIGIAEEDLEKIFLPFHVADIPVSVRLLSEFGRTGLGLAITKEYVKMHGGTIWAESRIGEGSTFHVVLPIDNR